MNYKKYPLMVLVAMFIHTIASLQSIDQLCFEKEVRSHIQVMNGVMLDSLTFSEKLEFIPSVYHTSHEERIGIDGKFISEMELIYQENFFPDYYQHPSTVVFENIGITAYFDEDYSFLDQGWIGAYDIDPEIGTFQEDSISNRKYYQLPHSVLSQNHYDGMNQEAQDYGLLYSYEFQVLDSSVLQNYQQQGYTIQNDSNVISVSNVEHSLEWDIENKIVKIEEIEDRVVAITHTFYYSYVESFNKTLLYAQVTEENKQFVYGDCYKKITQTKYTNYNTRCGEETINERSSISKEQIGKVRVYPNPSSESISIILPYDESKAKVKIINSTGNLLLLRSVSGQKEKTINIELLDSGMYILILEQNGEIFQSKFIKK